MKKKLLMLVATGVTGVALAGAVVSPALAWHPKGTIVKYVQNETTSSALADANDEASAITANTGDTLKYVIKVSNTGATDDRGWNDMANTVLKDTLPAGVELVSDASQRQITVNLGTIKPGKTVTKEYEVKVTSTTDGDVVTNQACFTGNSTANDNPQSGCDDAVVKVHVPETPQPPVTPPVTPTTPETPVTPETPKTLPNTGAGNIIVPAIIVSALGYAGYLTYLKRRAVQN
jgi:uncharacterized repeat protein (TIGR01451 family)